MKLAFNVSKCVRQPCSGARSCRQDGAAVLFSPSAFHDLGAQRFLALEVIVNEPLGTPACSVIS